MRVPCVSYILFLGLLSMCCMGVAMIFVGATYEDYVSTYLIVGGIFVVILYLLPMLLALAYIIETRNGENFWSKYEVVSFMLPLCFPLPLVCLGILIWGTIMVISASGNIIHMTFPLHQLKPNSKTQ